MNEQTVNSPEYWRNYGFWNVPEQQAILDARVVVGGVGGGGFPIVMALAQMGVRNFTFADPEVMEAVNKNRVEGAGDDTIGRNKAEVLRDRIMALNESANVKIYTEGVNEDNLEEFMNGATLVYDETDLSVPHIGTMICRQARKIEVPVVNANFIGFGAQVTSFHPKSKWTFEKFMGIPADMPYDEIADLKLQTSRYLAYLPRYGDLGTLLAVQNEDASLPSIKPGAMQAASLAATQGFLHMVAKANNHRPEPIWAPHVGYQDALTLQAGVIRHPQLSYYRGLALAVGRNALGINPKGSYRLAERTARERQDG